MRTLASWLAVVGWCACGLCGAAEALRFDFAPSPLERLWARQDAERRRLVCPRCAQPPRIDGVLDDAAWRQAAVFERLHAKGPATEVRLCFDDRALYIAVRCAQCNGRWPSTLKRQRSSLPSTAWKSRPIGHIRRHDDCPGHSSGKRSWRLLSAMIGA